MIIVSDDPTENTDNLCNDDEMCDESDFNYIYYVTNKMMENVQI